VVTSAQRRGTFKFTTKRGTAGTLSLKDDTVTLDTGEVVEARGRPYPRY
jgi:DNA/RNA endonuclease YhcR with UshA esterase domain